MNGLVRYWNQNRKRLITGIAILAFLIIVVRILNGIAKEQNRRERENRVVLTEEEQKLPTESIIGAGGVSVETAKEDVSQIEQFVEFCNKGEITAAYNMLTDDCKKTEFTTLEDFTQRYHAHVFKVRKIADIKNFGNSNNRDIYLVNFYEDVLATGNGKTTNPYTDYITIDKNQNNKISLRGLIYREELNSSSEYGGVKFTVVARNMYKDKEEFEITVENNSGKRIAINTGRSEEGVYAVGNNNISYGSNILQLSATQRQVPDRITRTYKIEFPKTFSSGVKITRIAFTDIVPDYEAYQNAPSQVNDRIQIFINL